MAETLSAPPKFPLEREQKSGKLTNAFTSVFLQWLLSLTSRIQTSPNVLAVIRLASQAAAIGSTPITLGTLSLSAGEYRLTFYARITTPATVNSSLTVSFGWTDNGVSMTANSAAITGNTATTMDSNTITVPADQATNLTYSTAYVSVGATPMQYKLTVVAERLN